MAVFELGGALAEILPDLAVGPWTSAAPGIAAFDAEAGPPESLWRVDLARDDAASRAAFVDGERSVARTHAVLDDVPRRLDQALAALARASRPRPAHDDHVRPPAPKLSPIEAGLVAALARAEVQLPPRPAGSPGPATQAPARLEQAPPGKADTSLSSDLSSDIQAHAPGPIAQAIQRVGDLVRGRARIETRIAHALVASSVTALSGDTELWIVPGLSPAGATLHARSVAVAVRTRHAWARVLTLVVACGGRLAALGLPPAGVAALPLLWGFLRDVLREVRDRDVGPGRAV